MLNITIKQMRYIAAAGRLGSIANAATELNISQSSISSAIDALEEELSYHLFVRTPAKGIKPTSSGNAVLVALEKFLTRLDHLESELRSIGGEEVGSLRIGCFVTAVGSFLPPILRQFTTSFPGVEIVLMEESMEGVVDLLNSGRVDMAFTYHDLVSPAHEFLPLLDVPPYALLPRNDPLAAKDSVSLKELSKLPMVLFDLPRTSGYYARFLTDAGHPVHIAHRTASVEMVRTLVSNGFGFSILNARSPEYSDDLSSYKALPIREKLQTRVFGILQPASVSQPKVVQAFVKLCSQLKADRVFDSMIVR